MKTITARQFSQNASEIGKYLSDNPLDYFYVSNKINPKKNFICCRLDFIVEAGNDIWKVQEIGLMDERSVAERRMASSKMSRKHWDNDKMGRNDNTNASSRKMEKIRSIVYGVDGNTSPTDTITSIADLESPRGRGKLLAQQVHSKGHGTAKNQSVRSIV
jgi:hypothetical protein